MLLDKNIRIYNNHYNEENFTTTNLRLVKSCYCLDTISLDNSAGLSSEPTAGAANSRALSMGMGFPSASCNGREGDDGSASLPYFTGERG